MIIEISYSKIKNAYQSSGIAQIAVFILFTAFIFATVFRQLYSRWTADYIYPRYIIVYMLEACYFLFGYNFSSKFIKEQTKCIATFFSFCLSLMCSGLFLYKGLKGAVELTDAIGSVTFATHPVIVWCVASCTVILIKKCYAVYRKNKVSK